MHMGEHGIGTTSSTQTGAPASAGQNFPASSASDTHPVLPKPQGGSGSHDLSTESSDPEVLRQHLERARERLTFYESFDRIIGENIRRSGELMLETISLREEAQERDRVVAQLEAERNAARAAEHSRNQTLLSGLLAEADSALAGLTLLRQKLADALASTAVTTATSVSASSFNEGSVVPGVAGTLGAKEVVPDAAAPSAIIDSARETALPVSETHAASAGIVTAEPVSQNAANGDNPQADAIAGIARSLANASASTPQAAPMETGSTSEMEGTAVATDAAELSAPRTIDVLVHGVSRAPIALSLQNYLKSLAGVSSVETREFAEGVLRLNVKTTNPTGLNAGDFAAWKDGGTIITLSEQETVLELSLSSDTDL